VHNSNRHLLSQTVAVKVYDLSWSTILAEVAPALPTVEWVN
jgi:hypothetical protein